MFENENRAQELRSRILDRVRNPCKHRFDGNGYGFSPMEHSFLDDVRNYSMILENAFNSPTIHDDEKYYIFGLKEELEWAENAVTSAWERQDDAMYAQQFKEKPPKPKSDPNQTVLF